ncbi:S-adenosyl-L-methionine-dependent methyltransferase [Hypoxylon trugodes]|uniref:S-adenosyl-L-methionine-dependent methyltransferase n=1 Tax=Hypoxylon trugodes TaxID=326681 RepID=UPI0021909BB2|nr:S-adenosyl-L-methionine-dependent methyltransferase [Hypoxylon trugodes]KAI1386829.1 S-adenosyl-L-methionine-dependent methyltransferase [Hypoxylon trugodes]
MSTAVSDSKVPKDIKERIKASYDAIAPKYNEWTSRNKEMRTGYLEKVFDLLQVSSSPTELHFLELGCGAGLPITRILLQSNPKVRVTANDLSTAQIGLAKENLLGSAEENAGNAERLALVEGDMTKLSFPDQSLDAVFGFYSLIHLPREEQTEMIKKVAGWLKPGGYLLVNFAEADTEAIVMEKWLDEKDWMFWSSWGKEKTLKIIEEAGLDIVLSEFSTDVVDASFLWVIAKR